MSLGKAGSTDDAGCPDPGSRLSRTGGGIELLDILLICFVFLLIF